METLKVKSSLLGHKSRCFDVRICEKEQLILSASEDGTARLFDMQSKKSLYTFKHNKKAEVLRAGFLNDNGTLIATCGADGKAIVWACSGDEEDDDRARSRYKKFEQVCILDHGEDQIYACETLQVQVKQVQSQSHVGSKEKGREKNHAHAHAHTRTNLHLLTAAENALYFWSLGPNGAGQPTIRAFRSIKSIVAYNDNAANANDSIGSIGSKASKSISSSASSEEGEGEGGRGGEGKGPVAKRAKTQTQTRTNKSTSTSTSAAVGKAGAGEEEQGAQKEETGAEEGEGGGGDRNRTRDRIWTGEEEGEGEGAGEESFGGPRNQEDIAYIFDAQPHSPPTGTENNKDAVCRVAVALSDGSIRIVALREGTDGAYEFSEQAIIVSEALKQLSNNNNGTNRGTRKPATMQEEEQGQEQEEKPPPHVTSVSWSSDGRSLLAALGNGLVVVLDIDDKDDNDVDNEDDAGRVEVVRASARLAVSGHERACYGADFLPLPPPPPEKEKGWHGSVEKSSISISSSSSFLIPPMQAQTRPQTQPQRFISWGSEGTLMVWSLPPRAVTSASASGSGSEDVSAGNKSTSTEETKRERERGTESEQGCVRPVATLNLGYQYPIYACTVGSYVDNGEGGVLVAVAGGSGDKNFVGVPVHLTYV